MSATGSWLVVVAVLFVGVCIGVAAVAWLIGDEVYDGAPKYEDDEEPE